MKARDAIDFSGISYEVSEDFQRLYDAVAKCDGCGEVASSFGRINLVAAKSHAKWALMSVCSCDRVRVPKPERVEVSSHMDDPITQIDVVMDDGSRHRLGDRLIHPLKCQDMTMTYNGTSYPLHSPRYDFDALQAEVKRYKAEDLAACDGGDIEPGKLVMRKPGRLGDVTDWTTCGMSVKLKAHPPWGEWTEEWIESAASKSTCGTCGGSGKFELFTSVERCEDCNGTGKA